ncbi:MAG: hypothetical protein AAFV45_00100 [Pseudomonadota bacterium]
MTVVIVHGTHDPDGAWWVETTPNDFAAEVDRGLVEAGSQPQVWRVGAFHVSAFDELRPEPSWSWFSGRTAPPFDNREGRFKWSGADLHGPGRHVGGKQLARYLEAVTELDPDETIHIIAHSHGCNVVKQATRELAKPVKLGRLVFLACPHFTDIHGGEPTYRIEPSVLGPYRTPILNFYSPQDVVQTTVARLMPDLGMAPGMPEIGFLGFEGTPLVESHRSDPDPAAAGLYEELEVEFTGGDGVAAHGAVHKPEVGRFLGYWFAQEADVPAHDLWSKLGLEKLAA